MIPNEEGRERLESLATQAKPEGRQAKSEKYKSKSKGQR